MSTLPHTSTTVLLFDRSEGSFDFFVGVEALLVHELIKSPAVEAALHLGEDCLDRVELGAVTDVEDRFDVQLLIQLSHLSCPMHTKLVHEQGEWPVLKLDAKFVEILFEVSCIDGAAVNYNENHAVLFSHGCYH